MKNVLITGGTKGIGKAMALAFMDAGYFAIITSRNPPAEGSFAGYEGKFKHYSLNVGDFDSVQETVGKIIADNGPIAVLINNAGITKDKTFKGMTKEMWDAVIGTNLNGVFNVTKAVMPSMIEQKFGRVINISSVVGLKGNFGQTNYCSTKAGVIGFTKALAYESIRNNITVNAIAPGFIATEMTEAMPEEVLANIIKTIPAGRMGKPEEIAHAALFLADEKSGYITGETLSVNGGQYMH